MSTVNKLSYLNDTKSLLRTSLNKFGSSILSTDTFRSYDTELNDIYDKLPKITQSGAGFTLENVQNGLVDDFKMLGVDLIQDGEPSPDYPQEIKVVEGRQVINVKGKNLFNFGIRSRNQNGITTNYNFSQAIINGTTTTNDSIVGFSTKISEYSISLGTYSAGSYVFKFEKVSGNLTYPSGASAILIRNSNDTTIFKNNVNSETTNYTKSFTLEQETELFIQWFVNESNWTFTDYICRFMIISDTDSATDYEPYYNPASYNIDLNLENIQLAKMPNTDYKNRVYKNNGNWYFEENVKKVVLDGSDNEDWANHLKTKILSISRDHTFIIMCNYFKPTTNSSWVSNDDSYRGMCSSLNTVGQIKFMPLEDMTLNEFKTWLSTHNVEVWCQLDNPVTTQITNTTLINQLEVISVHTGTNIITISNDNNIIPEIEITRLKELEKLA